MSGLLLVAAGVHTLSDGGGPTPRAVLIEGERIAWVGADPAQAPGQPRVVDLGGDYVTPAFVDAHVHATATGLAEAGVDLSSGASLAECLARVRDHAEAGGSGVLDGYGWEETTWPEGRAPTAAEVSAAAPGRTVLLLRVDAHSCVVDAGTLTRLPLNGLPGVDRDAGGGPTGLLREQAAGAALTLVQGLRAAGELRAARDAVCRRAAALGIGSLHEMGHPALSGLDDALAWAAGDWPVEVHVWWAELDADAGSRHGLRPGGDLFLDGSIGSHTAAVSAPYLDGGGLGGEDLGGGGLGELFHDDDAVGAFYRRCTAAGLGAGVHAIGDRAIEQAITVMESAAEQLGLDAVRACRHRVEHAELPSRDQVARLARLGVVASVQPAFDAAWGGPDGLYARRFGREAAVRSNPLSWFAEAGARLAFGSDSTVTPLDPWGAVHAAEHHGGGLGLPRREALAAHTLGGRYVAGQDDVGVLSPGQRADLAVWDTDPLLAGDVRELTCQATMVAGRAVYGSL